MATECNVLVHLQVLRDYCALQVDLPRAASSQLVPRQSYTIYLDVKINDGGVA